MDNNNMYVSTLGEEIYFRSVRETRFKDSAISVQFIMPLSRETITVYNALSGVMYRTCAKYPDPRALDRACAMLYDASLDTGIAGMGSSLEFTVEIRMNEDRFIPGGEKISAQCASLLSEMIFRPARNPDGSLFLDDEIEITVRNIKEQLESRINNKAAYAANDFFETMYAGEVVSIDLTGYIDDLPGVTHASLEEAWRKMLSTAVVNIVMVGSMEHEPVERIFLNEFAGIARSCPGLPEPPEVKEAVEERTLIRRMDVRQSKLFVGMRLPVLAPDDRVMHAGLMSRLYGAGTDSLLFKNLREKMGICYSCSCNYMSLKGLLIVYCGLDEKNYEKALEEIRRQLAVIADNAFTEEEFEAVKTKAVNGYDYANDSVGAIKNWYSSQIYDGCVRTPEQSAERMRAVTRSQVAACASLAKVDAIYLLAPEHPQGGEEEGEDGDE